jgi:hypothetical protein
VLLRLAHARCSGATAHTTQILEQAYEVLDNDRDWIGDSDDDGEDDDDAARTTPSMRAVPPDVKQVFSGNAVICKCVCACACVSHYVVLV